MGPGEDDCVECDRLLETYIASLRAVGAPGDSSEQGRLEAEVQQALARLLRHEYAHAAQQRRRTLAGAG